MKTLLRYSFLMLVALISGNMSAGTIVFGDLGLENGVQYPNPFDGGDFTVTFGGGGNDGKYYNTGSGIRVYGGGTMTIAAKSGNISKIVVTYDGSNKPADGTVVNGGTYDAETGVWTGSANSVVFTRPTGSGHWRVQKIEVTLEGAGPTVQEPKFSVAGGLYFEPQTVALSCEEGAKILYTIPAGQDPVYTDDENYSGVFYDGTPLTISRTTTIKAMAVKDGKTSNIVTATYTIVNVENKGTADNPFTVADALTVIAALAEGATTSGTFFVKGTVVGTPDIQKKADGTFYGNANFDIADTADGTTKLTCYRLKGLENANIDNENYVRAKDVVVVKGQLQRFVKDGAETPEIKNGFIYSLDNSASVQDVKAAENGEGSAFNLAGQRVSANYKGVVIKNGKKNILK